MWYAIFDTRFLIKKIFAFSAAVAVIRRALPSAGGFVFGTVTLMVLARDISELG